MESTDNNELSTTYTEKETQVLEKRRLVECREAAFAFRSKTLLATPKHRFEQLKERDARTLFA